MIADAGQLSESSGRKKRRLFADGIRFALFQIGALAKKEPNISMRFAYFELNSSSMPGHNSSESDSSWMNFDPNPIPTRQLQTLAEILLYHGVPAGRQFHEDIPPIWRTRRAPVATT